MSINLQIWWIDDELDRLTKSAQRLIERPEHPALRNCSATLHLQHVKTAEEIDALVSMLAAAKSQRQLPDLIVVDQILNVQSADGIVQRGSSLAVMLRVQAPSVPLVGVTGAPAEDVAALQRDQFIDLLSRDAVNRGTCIPDLYAIAKGFSVVAKNLGNLRRPGIHRKLLLRLIASPEADEELLFASVPGDFKRHWDSETIHSFARWVWHTLLGRPGFLYDDLETATLLGLKESALSKIEDRFRGCEYTGVFASVSRRRWWVSEIRNTVRKLGKSKAFQALPMLGRALVLDVAQHSKCFGVNQKDCIPDVVAYQDELLKKRIQARAEDTVPLESDTPPFGFEQRRKFQKVN